MGRSDSEGDYPAGEGAMYCEGPDPSAFAHSGDELSHAEIPTKMGYAHGLDTPKSCTVCGSALTGLQERYCREACRDKANKARRRARRMPPPPVCGGCGAGVPTRHHKWCPACLCDRKRTLRFDARRRYLDRVATVPFTPEAQWEIPASTVGAIGELAVAADLLRRGFEVYRAVSPAASCDLLVQRDGSVYRVEVRATRRDRTGGLQNRVTSKDLGRYDVMALVEPDGAIHYSGLEMEAASGLRSRSCA